MLSKSVFLSSPNTLEITKTTDEMKTTPLHSRKSIFKRRGFSFVDEFKGDIGIKTWKNVEDFQTRWRIKWQNSRRIETSIIKSFYAITGFNQSCIDNRTLVLRCYVIKFCAD